MPTHRYTKVGFLSFEESAVSTAPSGLHTYTRRLCSADTGLYSAANEAESPNITSGSPSPPNKATALAQQACAPGAATPCANPVGYVALSRARKYTTLPRELGFWAFYQKVQSAAGATCAETVEPSMRFGVVPALGTSEGGVAPFHGSQFFVMADTDGFACVRNPALRQPSHRRAVSNQA